MDELYTSEIKKISINDDTLNCMPPADFLKFWKLQDDYLRNLENDLGRNSTQKATVLRKLKELAKLRNEIDASCRKAQSLTDFDRYTVDPVVQQTISSLNEDLAAKRRLQKVMETDLHNCSYSVDNQVGKLLIAKSRQLSEENMELQSEIRQGSLCQAQAKLCLQRQHKHTLNALFKDHSDLSVELEQQLKESQLKLADVQNCYKMLFREEAASTMAAAAASNASSQSNKEPKSN
ncbi:uncharacterized protein LOC134851141 [Symsagittifera roscoffensis]|uniref:uncharacterized protein LOC134851141 n=1 Tax=Symsagittifera roscoffensis TaxID=84072 RepID=UPI00307BF752